MGSASEGELPRPNPTSEEVSDEVSPDVSKVRNNELMPDPARYVRVHPSDPLGIIVNPEGVPEGAPFAEGLVARERIPQSHKIALQRIAKGEPVRRYGQTIGLADRDVEPGKWLRDEWIVAIAAPDLDSLSLATATPSKPEPLDGYTFEGFRNADGSVGTRNILGITTTVQCVAPTVDYAVRRIQTELLPRFPNVDDAVSITHTYGCGVAIDAPGAAIPIRTLKHISLHANLMGEPMLVSLGCEKLQPA